MAGARRTRVIGDPEREIAQLREEIRKLKLASFGEGSGGGSGPVTGGAKIYASADQTDLSVEFDSVAFDTLGGSFDSGAPYALTFPESGIYVVSCGLAVKDLLDGADVHVQLFRSDSSDNLIEQSEIQYGQTLRTDTGSSYSGDPVASLHHTWIIHADATDYVFLVVGFYPVGAEGVPTIDSGAGDAPDARMPWLAYAKVV